MITFIRFFKQYYFSFLIVLIISYLSLSSGSMGNNISWFDFPDIDKLFHFFMYFVLSCVIFYDLTKNRKDMSLYFKLLTVIIVGIFYGGLMEIFQNFFTSTREGDWIDFLADSLGVGFFILIYVLFKPLKKLFTSS